MHIHVILQGGARKARRTGNQQQNRQERMDYDGDVAMADAGVFCESLFACVRVFALCAVENQTKQPREGNGVV